MTFIVRKDPTLKRSLFAAMNESVPPAQQQSSSEGQDLWLLDPYGEDDDYQGQYDALDTPQQQACVFLQGFTRDLLLRKCDHFLKSRWKEGVRFANCFSLVTLRQESIVKGHMAKFT